MRIRLMGLLDEVQAVQQALATASGLRVLETSALYPNRGDSHLVRVYLDIQPTTAVSDAELPEAEDGD